jgi:predicted aconitase with swiveling domain
MHNTHSKAQRITAKAIIPGDASGPVLMSRIPLSFWGGVDAFTGNVIDVRHDLCGVSMKGRVLIIPEIRGSCSTSGVILEMIRRKTAPVAIITQHTEAILAAGSIIGKALYQRWIPIYTVEAATFDDLENGVNAVIKEDHIDFI